MKMISDFGSDTAKELLINMEELYIDEKRSVFKGNYDKIMKKMMMQQLKKKLIIL